MLTEIPSVGGLVAILQKRGDFNHEKMEPESWPGACQLTAHGKCEENESMIDALIREVQEELEGPDIPFERVRGFGMIIKFEADKLTELNRVESETSEVVNYGVRVANSLIPMFRLSPSTGGLRLVHRVELASVIDVRSFDKIAGVPLRATIAMFPDELDAVKIAFEKVDALGRIDHATTQSITVESKTSVVEMIKDVTGTEVDISTGGAEIDPSDHPAAP